MKIINMFPIPNHNPESNFDFPDWRQVEDLMELVPFDNQRNGPQQPRPNNQPVMSFSSGPSNFNFWGNGPISVNIYPGGNSHFHFHQTTAPNYLQPGPTVQSPPHLSPMINVNGNRFEVANPAISFPSPSFSDAASSFGSLQNGIGQASRISPSATSATSSQTSSTLSPDVHRFTPHYSTEYLHEFFDWELHRARMQLEEEQNEASEQNDPVTSNGSAVAGPSVLVPNLNPQRSRHTAAPVNRPATRAYTRQQKKSV